MIRIKPISHLDCRGRKIHEDDDVIFYKGSNPAGKKLMYGHVVGWSDKHIWIMNVHTPKEPYQYMAYDPNPEHISEHIDPNNCVVIKSRF